MLASMQLTFKGCVSERQVDSSVPLAPHSWTDLSSKKCAIHFRILLDLDFF